LGKNIVYTTRISKTLSLLKETKLLFQELDDGRTNEEIYQMVLEDNLFDKTSLASRKKTYSVLKNRFLIDNRVNATILQRIINSNLSENIINHIIYYYFSKSEDIVYEITTKVLYEMYLEGKSIISKKDISEFLESQSKNHKEIEDWSESTKEHIAQHYLAIMRDFGFLKGKHKKQFDIPSVPTEVILFILFEKLDQNENIKQILNSDDFKLFFLEKEDLIHYFEEGTRLGYIRFNYTKDIYDLNNLGNTLEAYVNDITGKV